ncbi:MAG: hypothetical protein HYU33_05100 [Candidatus Omnitrophica bacterium]|nr:hypothetical protein [Candidatus Omnitrophota bacterium]
MSNIIISGLTAAGKTTHSKILAERFRLRYVGASMLALGRKNIDPQEISPDYWLTDEGISLLHDVGPDIDQALLELESDGVQTVFDCFFLPWLRHRPALCIWLESDFESRILKAIVSHQGRGRFSGKELRERMRFKDDHSARMLKGQFGHDLYSDKQPFAHVIDISGFICEATSEASRASIRSVNLILEPIVEAYLSATAKVYSST